MHGVLRDTEKCSNITTQCTKETCIYRKNQGYVKDKQITSKKEDCFRILHQRLGHRSTRSLLAGDTANIWEDVELRIDPEPFYTSCQISSMNKKYRYKIPLKSKAPFKWVFTDIIPST